MKALACISLVGLLLVPCARAQQSANLTDLKLLAVEIEALSQVDREIGLSSESVRSFVLAKIDSELPEIEVDPIPNDFIRVRIMTVKANESSVASYVSVELERYVVILRDEDRQAIGNTNATVWENSAVLIGSAQEMGSKIQAELGRQLTVFATEYHRQNPRSWSCIPRTAFRNIAKYKET